MTRSRQEGAGWKRVTLGDVVRQVRDVVSDPLAEGVTHYVPGGGISADGFEITLWEPVDDGLMGPAFRSRFRTGHVLYKSRVPHGVAVADREGLCADTTYVLEPSDPALHPGLLPFLLTTDHFRAFEESANRGSTNLFINFSDLARYEFALPPIGEQERAIQVLTAIENAERRFRAVASMTRTLRSSLCREILSGAPGSTIRNIGDVLTVVAGGTPSRGSPGYWGGTIPWVKTAEVNFTVITDTEERITERGLAESAAKILPRNSVLVALYGQGPTRGRVAMLGVEAATNQACAAVLPSDDLDPWFVYYYLESSYEQLRGLAHGAAQPNLNLSMIKAFPIPVPPLDFQSDAVAALDAVARVERAAGERSSDVRSIRTALAGAVIRR